LLAHLERRVTLPRTAVRVSTSHCPRASIEPWPRVVQTVEKHGEGFSLQSNGLSSHLLGPEFRDGVRSPGFLFFQPAFREKAFTGRSERPDTAYLVLQ